MGGRRIALELRQEAEGKVLRYATRNQLRAEAGIWKRRIEELKLKFGDKDDRYLHAKWARAWLISLAKQLYPEGPNGTATPVTVNAEPNG